MKRTTTPNYAATLAAWPPAADDAIISEGAKRMRLRSDSGRKAILRPCPKCKLMVSARAMRKPCPHE